MKGLFSFFTKRADTPIEAREYGKIYLLLSGLLFLGTMWAVIDEISTRRPWKEYQDEYFRLSINKWQERLKEAEAGFDSASYVELSKQLADAESKLSSPDVVAIQKEIESLDNELLDATRDYTFAKSRGDEAYYFWKKSIHEGEESEKSKNELRELEAEMVKTNARVEALTSKRDSLDKIVEAHRNAIKEARTKVRDLYTQIDLAKSKIEKAEDATIGIRQVMNNNFDLTNFGTPKARIDRCQTCHTGWKDETMEEAPQPFKKHPLAELLKIHDPETFGCTPCHRGQGTALTAGFAHGNDDHYWEWPLLKGEEVYASCNSCHQNQLYLKDGGRLNKAKQMLLESGCFGCHEIKGFLDAPKIGPEINNLAVKVESDWLFRWIRNPKDYNPHSRMPNFRFNDDQSEAVAAYLMNISKDATYQPRRGVGSGGNVVNGKALFESVGCKGCHVAGEDTRMRQARGFSYDVAPELTRAGSKLNADWVFEWIKNPRAFRPTTKMPSLRLTDQEARDITAYLMTLKDDRKFEQKKLSMDDPDLIKKGDKLIREYGCAGCHVIKGMEKESKVSVALSNFGKKRVDELDFGDTKVPHTWDDWVFGKLKDARQYTTERIISKMPVFALADSEIVVLRTLLRGMTKEVPEPEYQQAFDKRVQSTEAGRKLVSYYNCINCHQIEEIGGSIKAVLDDEAMAPPYLLPEGSKVQENWLHDFLKMPTPIRPWLNIRMPSFQLTDQEITTISKYFLALHSKELELRDYQPTQPDPKYLSVGKTLFNDLQCLSCHYTGRVPEGKTPADLAPNLALSKTRLKPEWIAEWIARPDSIQPGTRMPNFFPDLNEKSPYSDELNGDTREQIKAIRDYVNSLGKDN
jgi:mono/diheme cytochrome c family protein